MTRRAVGCEHALTILGVAPKERLGHRRAIEAAQVGHERSEFTVRRRARRADRVRDAVPNELKDAFVSRARRRETCQVVSADTFSVRSVTLRASCTIQGRAGGDRPAVLKALPPSAVL